MKAVLLSLILALGSAPASADAPPKTVVIRTVTMDVDRGLAVTVYGAEGSGFVVLERLSGVGGAADPVASAEFPAPAPEALFLGRIDCKVGEHTPPGLVVETQQFDDPAVPYAKPLRAWVADFESLVVRQISTTGIRCDNIAHAMP